MNLPLSSQSATKEYHQLLACDQCTFQALAVCQEDVNIGDLTRLLKDVQRHEPGLWFSPPTQPTIVEIVRSLGRLGLAVIGTLSMTRISVNPHLRDFGMQQAILAGRFVRLDALMRKQQRLDDNLRPWQSSRAANWLLARSNFYHGEVQTFLSSSELAGIEENRVVALELMTSWDPQVFQALPAALQRETLIGTLTRSLLMGSASDNSVQQFKTLVLNDEPAAQVWADLRVQWLAAAGDIAQLTQLALSDSPAKDLAAGCCAFLKGSCEEASAEFRKYLSALNKAGPPAAPVLSDVAGLMQFLSVMREDPRKLRKSLKTFCTLMKKRRSDSLGDILECATQAVDYSVSMEAPERLQLARKMTNDWSELSKLNQVLLAHLWKWFIPDHAFPAKVDSQKLTEWYVRNGLKWLAALCEDGQSLGKHSSDQKHEPLGSAHKQLGTFPMAAWIKQPEIWKQKLEALRRLATPQTTQSTKVGEEPSIHNERLIWELELKQTKTQVSVENLRPIVQTRSGKGWTKGRPIALVHLHGHAAAKKLHYLSPQDREVCSCIESYESSSGYYDYTDTAYALDRDSAIVGLVGHPLIFPANERTQTLELVSREPELVIEEAAAGFRIALAPTPNGAGTIVLSADGPQRFAVVRFTTAQLQLSKVLGKGITVPASGQAELLATAQALSAVAAVQSAVALVPAKQLSGTSTTEHDNARSVAADPATLVHLTPCQEGIRAEFFVRPFGANGPLFSPGVGGKSIFAVIDQQRLVTERDFQAEQERVAVVFGRCPSLAGAQETFVAAVDLPTAEEALELVSELEPLHEQGLVAVYWPQGKRLRVAGRAECSQLTINMKSDKDWFAASGELVIDKQMSIDLVQLADLISAKPSAFIPLTDGRFLRLSEQLRQRVAALAAFSDRQGNTLRFPPIRAAAMDDIDQWCKLKAGKAWKDRQLRIREAVETNFQLPSTLNATLRDYQAEGFQWVCRLAHWGAGACLADDMGLGKTLQAIALLLHRAADGPALVVAPTSLGFNWETELFRFAPTLKVHIFGNGDRETLLAELGPRDIVIASYGLLQNDSQRFKAIKWHTVVLDEAQAIKNMATKRSQAAMELQANFRMILTGTPIENHLGELWNLMQFINPGLLGSSEQFQRRFAIPIERDHDRETRQQLKRLVQPFLLRRTKSQVLTELPARTEVTISVSLSDEEALLYEAARQRAVEQLAAAAESKQGQHLRILAELMRLRRACCHPSLLLPECNLPGAKLEAFSQTIDELLANRHKALVFSQFVDHLTILRAELDRKGISYQYLDGSTPVKERRRSVDAFQDGKGDVFLISLKAGGTGLNLTAADYVLHMDPWWNPAVEDQAADRAHRIGQLRPVTIYRFITRGTIEEKILELHKNKRDLADSLLEGTDTSGSLTADELLKLIQP